MHPKRHLPRKRTMIFPYLVIAPAIILILIFKLYPIVLNIWSSFQGNDGFSTGNYARIFGDRNFWNSILTTFKFCIILIPVQIVISFGMALLVSQRLRGIGAFRTIYYLPVTVSITVACINVEYDAESHKWRCKQHTDEIGDGAAAVFYK